MKVSSGGWFQALLIPKSPFTPFGRAYTSIVCNHYIDYMFGTDTGGLIAILPDRLRLTVKEALKLHEILVGKVFGKQRVFFMRDLFSGLEQNKTVRRWRASYRLS